MLQAPVGLPRELSCEAGSLSCCHNPHRCFQSDFGALFPSGGTLGIPITQPTSSCLPTLLHNPPPRWVRQPLPCRECSQPRLPFSSPPTSLDECFFFNSLVVGLPYSSIFCQFWLFFVFKLLSTFCCVRRHSVSTCASILAGCLLYISFNVI